MNPNGSKIGIACAWGLLVVPVLWAADHSARADTPEPLLSIEGLAGFEVAAGDAGLATFETAAAARRDAERTATPRESSNSDLVRRIQDGLAQQGFYLGMIDGRFGPRTEAAIRAYQESADLPVDGKPSIQLMTDIETGGKVRDLLNRLEKSRDAAMIQAREALLAHPQTRSLIEGADAAQGQKHDTKACMASPTPKCLLVEATISARDIDKPEMRDWALGEILTSQAKAGLAPDALITTRRIHDPRLIVVALRDIAKAQAEAGNTEAAMAAVDIIPDLVQQVEAYVAIAEAQVQKGHVDEAAKTAVHMLGYLRRIDSAFTKVTFRTRIAAILYSANKAEQASENIRAAEQLVPTIKDKTERNEAIRYIAAAYAETGFPAKAMETLKTVEAGGDDMPVLIAAATKLAQAGSSSQALVTADSIEAVRYRALVLARIASYQAGAGDLQSARTTLTKASDAAQQIKFPFAKAYAFSRIALALNDVAISGGNDAALMDQSLQTAALIKDDRLKAHIYWTIADERRRANAGASIDLAQSAADTATADIMSPFSRVWMLCDIAEERAQMNEIELAWAVFSDALDEAKTITNPWGRARAFGKVAGTMTALTDLTANIARR